MSHAQVTAMFSAEDHPRAPAGSSTGGQFAKDDGSSSSKPPAKKAAPAKTSPKRKGRTRREIPKGQLGFDGVSGTGYGVKGGDKRVRALQEELNRLGLTDSRGRKLRVDGELGPLTTQAVKAAQRRLGMRPTGIIAPAFIDRLRATKAMPKPVKKAAARKSVYAKFDPTQKRDDHGRWSKIGAALHAIAEMARVPVVGHETFGAEDGSSHSHGIVAAHPGGDFTLALHDKDAGTRPVMTIGDGDALEELRTGFEEVWSAHDRDPNSSGSQAAEDGSWRIAYDADGATLHANFDDDDASEQVRLSHNDVKSMATALEDVSNKAENAAYPDHTASLSPDETLRGRKKVLGDPNAEFAGVAAVVDTGDGPHVRLGAIQPGDRGARDWTGGRGMTTVDLDQADAARVADVLERYDAEGKRRQAIYDKHFKAAQKREDAGEDVDWDEVESAALDEIGYAGKDFNDGHVAAFEDDYETDLIETPWGTVRLTDVGMDDDANAHERHIRMEIWPAGMTEEEYDAGQSAYDGPDWAWPGSSGKYQKPDPDLLPKDIKALVKMLRDTFGATASPVTAAELRGIELARPGRWKLASGPMTVTKQHLIDAARYAQRKAARPGYVKIGHNDPRFAPGDGEPALGWVHNVRYAEDERGPKLVGDIHDMPDWLAAAAPTAWPDRSIEGWADFTDEDGEKYALVVDGVALLGVTPPGMSSIQSLRDLPKAVGVAAASGVRVVASMSSAPMAAEEGAGPMDPAITRTALGLSADAPDDEVASAMEAAAAALRGDPAPAPVQASLFGDEPKPAQPAMPTLPKGVQVIASSKLDELNATIKSLSTFVEASKRKERDEVIATAVKAGKFLPAQRPDFVRMWDEAPDATRALIDKLTPNSALAVIASGYAGGIAQEEDELDRELARLSRPEVRNG